MLTRQGWLVGGGAALLIVFGRLLGVFELFLLGAAAAGLLALSVISVARVRLRLKIDREVSPPRVHAGRLSRVELKVRNVGTRTTPVLRLFDPVSRTRGASLLLGPLEPLSTAHAAYRLPTERRGIVRIGPLDVSVGDPFGLVSASTRSAPKAELTVFPHIDDIAPLPQTTGHDPLAGADHPTALGRTGDDFYALRQYVVGDDLRRVHWPSTARRDELMVRQDELPWQGRVTVLVDVRRSAHTVESLEMVISAAASVVTASWTRRDLVRLLSSDGADSGFAAGSAHVEAIMEHLATVEATPGGTFRPMVDSLARTGGGGGLVVIVAAISEPELQALARLRQKFGSLTIVQFDRSAYEPASPPAADSKAGGASLLRVTREVSFPSAWNRAMQSRARIRPPAKTGSR